MTGATCPHGLTPGTCEICRVLEPAPVLAARPTSRSALRRSPRRGVPSLATGVVVAVLAFIVVGWVAAALFAVLRILELVAVAVVTGWAGYRLGHWRGRSGRP